MTPAERAEFNRKMQAAQREQYEAELCELLPDLETEDLEQLVTGTDRITPLGLKVAQAFDRARERWDAIDIDLEAEYAAGRLQRRDVSQLAWSAVSPGELRRLIDRGDAEFTEPDWALFCGAKRELDRRAERRNKALERLAKIGPGLGLVDTPPKRAVGG